MTATQHSVRVLVLGDVTRSPRIRNHALSFVKEQWRVCFSGYRGADCEEKEPTDDGLSYSFIQPAPDCIDWLLPRVLALIFKVVLGFFFQIDLLRSYLWPSVFFFIWCGTSEKTLYLFSHLPLHLL